MVHEGSEPSDPNQGPLDDSSAEAASDAVVGATTGATATPLPDAPVAVAKPSDTPPVRTKGPLLPMRIIGVNAVSGTNQSANVPRPTPAAPAPSNEEPPESPRSQRPPASIPPPKPGSNRAPRSLDETPLGGLETAVNNAYELAPEVSLRAPAIPVELEEQIELSPESARESELPTKPVPSGPPPLPPERRISGQVPKESPVDSLTNDLPTDSGGPPLPAQSAPGDEQATEVEPTSVEAQDTDPQLDSTLTFEEGRVSSPNDALTPGPRSDRSKPPALPSRPKRADGDGRPEFPSKPTQSAPSNPAPASPERGRQKKRRPPPIPPPRVAFTSGVEEESTKRKSWFEEVFGDDFLRANAELTEPQLQREVDFIERSLNLEKPAAILDLACGSGRHAVELNRRGYVTVGYDLSVTQLARASETAQAEGVRASFLQGDMREMAFDQMFDAVICWNASFGYFEEEKNVAVLKNIHRALKPGGCFLLDIPNRDFIVSQQPAQNWFEGDGCVCMDDMHVDFITSRLCVKRTIMLDDGRNKECLYSIRLFGLHELGRMLHEIGFRVNEVSGHIATRGVFMGATSPRLIVAVTKR